MAQVREAARVARRTPLSSIEFKISLDPSRFGGNPEAPAREFWKIARRVAASHGLKEDDDGSPLDRDHQRIVQFLDTPDFSLYKQGLLVRKREEAGEPTQLTMKARGRQHDDVANVDTSAAGNYESVSKLELDVNCGSDILQGRWSKSTTATIPTGQDAAPLKVFPQLQGRATTALTPVNGHSVDERTITLGRLRLSEGVKAHAVATVWREHGQPVIAEFSFRWVADDKATPQDVDHAERAGEHLLLDLRGEAREWVADGGTKTEYVYGTR